MYQNSPGVITKDGNIDFLYRVALRALIRNENGDILIVKEKDRDWWELPGGGLEYGENIKEGLARELHEEIGLSGDFDYHILTIQTPGWNERLGAMQMNVIFELKPKSMHFRFGIDGRELAFQPKEKIYEINPPDSKICIQLNTIL